MTTAQFSPAIERARLMKACEIEEIAVEGGVSAADLSLTCARTCEGCSP